MDTQAIILGSIGTLVDLSRTQRQAFDQAFAEAGLDWQSSEDDERRVLKSSGERGLIADHVKTSDQEINSIALQGRKTEILHDAIVAQGLCARAGILQLMAFAKANSIKVGLATTASADHIAAIFKALDGALHRSDFDFVGNSTLVTTPKPDPEIFLLAIDLMGVTASATIAIVDTPVSLRAAQAAGLQSFGFPAAPLTADDFEDDVRCAASVDPEQVFERS